jgi:hypothetical protein
MIITHQLHVIRYTRCDALNKKNTAGGGGAVKCERDDDGQTMLAILLVVLVAYGLLASRRLNYLPQQ